jgi:DNA adenine methylase
MSILPTSWGTRASKGRSYAHELSDSDHRELFETLRGLSGYVLLSAYEDDLYRELYGEQGWVSHTLEARVNGGARAREVLWLNPRLASELSHVELETGEGRGGIKSLRGFQ